MPLLEIIHAAQETPSREQKQAFAQDVVGIFHDVLGTPDGRLRVVFYSLGWEDALPGLLESPSNKDDSA